MPLTVFVELNYVGNAEHTESKGANRHGRYGPQTTPGLALRGFCTVVENATLSCISIFRPLLLDMDEGALARAV
jgi:hypothetical protein